MGQAARPGMGGRLLGGGLYRHRFGHQSGPEQSSRKKSAAILCKISARIFSAFSKNDEKQQQSRKTLKIWLKMMHVENSENVPVLIA
jgi:hypothetical protein